MTYRQHPERARFTLLMIATALIGVLGVALISTPAANARDKDCADFQNQKKAQKFFKKHNPKRDPHRLDADNDGIACESNRCPCKKKPAFRVRAESAGLLKGGCDRIKLGGEKRVFYKNRMGCRRAKTYARRLARNGKRSEPKNFKCTSGGGWRSGGYCKHRFDANTFFGWHPLD
jgi:hypothetical protein